MSENKYVVRIMATIFDEEDTEIENPKPVVLDIRVGAHDVEQAQCKVIAAIGKLANDPHYFNNYDENMYQVEDRMRRIAGLPPGKGSQAPSVATHAPRRPCRRGSVSR